MKKRLVSVVLVAAFAFSMLAGCGSDNSASKDNNKTSAEAEQTATNSGDGFNITVNFRADDNGSGTELLRRWSYHGKPFIRRSDEMGEHR